MLYDPDPWNDECPDANDLSEDDLLTFLDVIHGCEHLFTAWEIDFIYSLIDRLESTNRPLTDRQCEKLNEGILKKLWDHDPELWDL